MRYHTIVAGLGAMGAATVYQLAKRGVPVLGIDRFSPPHTFGSSHGQTRITRQAIGEGTQYSPLSLRSYQLWREIERDSGCDLLTITGGLVIARASVADRGTFLGNTLRAAQQYDIEHEVFDIQQVRQRFPQFNLMEDEVAYWERNAGFLRPEACIEAQLELARRDGAEFRTDERVLGFEPLGQGVRVRTDRGSYEAERVIVAAGAWIPKLLGAHSSGILKVVRQVLYWFLPQASFEPFQLERFPIFLWEPRADGRPLYGFPGIDGRFGGVKVGSGLYEVAADPDALDRSVPAAEIAEFYENLVRPRLPGLSGRCVRAATCMYTVTPDHDFVIDTHPEHANMHIVSACSGHGFKHSAAVGEALAQIACEGRSALDLSPFSLARFS